MSKSLFQDDLNPFKTVTDWRFGRGTHTRGDSIIVRGRVEYNRDPEHRGRVMVRVLEDGPEMRISNPQLPRVATFDLGWCDPMFTHSSGMGFGSFSVPVVGARVFVMYERGAEENPVYFGGWFANTPRKRRYGVTRSTLTPPIVEFEDDPGYTAEGEPGAGGKYQYPPKPAPYHGDWQEEQGPELPLELSEMLDHTPDTHLFFKTLKGASLIVKERDEAEEFSLVDHMGAGLHISSHTLLSEEGVTRRGRVTAWEHEPITLDNLSKESHSLLLVTATKSGMEIESNIYGADSLAIQVHPEQDIKKNTEVMPTRVAVELDEGEQRVRILYMEQGEEVGSITFDAAGRHLEIQGIERTRIFASEDIVLSSPKVRILGDVDIEGEIRHMGGKKFTFLGNDMEPYGSQTRNYWPFRESTNPYPYHDSKYDRKAATKSNERRWW